MQSFKDPYSVYTLQVRMCASDAILMNYFKKFIHLGKRIVFNKLDDFFMSVS